MNNSTTTVAAILYDCLSDVHLHRRLWYAYWDYPIRTQKMKDVEQKHKFVETMIIAAIFNCSHFGTRFEDYGPLEIQSRFFQFLDEHVRDYGDVPLAQSSMPPTQLTKLHIYGPWIQTAIKNTISSMTVIPTLHEIDSLMQNINNAAPPPPPEYDDDRGSVASQQQQHHHHHQPRRHYQKPPRAPSSVYSQQPDQQSTYSARSRQYRQLRSHHQQPRYQQHPPRRGGHGSQHNGRDDDDDVLKIQV